MKSKTKITIYINDDVLRKLKEHQEKTDLSMSSIVNLFIRVGLVTFEQKEQESLPLEVF